MQLIINNQAAVLKQGASFDYVSENRSFSDADDYSLSITLPLAGCPENLRIFGHAERKDTANRRAILEATIIDGTFMKHGVVTVVEANASEVKVQFLEGRSVQNFDTTFDDIYINELDLGEWPVKGLPSSGNVYLNPNDALDPVVLPWVNEDTGDLLNGMKYSGDTLVWDDLAKEMGGVSFMPYLITIAKRIVEAVGYTYDFTAWEQSPDKYLLICNTLPFTWDIYGFARALPHWSVTEFFEEVEKLLVAEIDIDHREKTFTLRFCSDIDPTAQPVRLDKVVDTFSAEVSYDDSLCQYKGTANIRYHECDYTIWKLYQCQWLVDMLKASGTDYVECADYAEFNQLTGSGATWEQKGKLYYLRDTDSYYLYIKSANVAGPIIPYQVNQFGDVIIDEASDNEIELNMAPVAIQEADYYCVYLQPSSFAEESQVDENGTEQPYAYATLLNGKPDGKPEYYDRIYLAHWDGTPYIMRQQYYNEPPCPTNAQLALKPRYAGYLSGIRIDPRHKVKFSWLASKLPAVRSLFNICGKRYLCEKITATFTETGMSQMLKGDFYPVSD